MRRSYAIVACLFATVASAQSNREVALKDQHFLDVKFAWGATPASDPFSLLARVESIAPSGDTASARDLDRPRYGESPTPLQSLAVHGKWWTILGDLVTNLGLVWSYRDVFHVTNAAGQTFKLDRQEIAKHPDLMRRFAAARPEFDRLEIFVLGTRAQRANVGLTFLFDSTDLIVAREGKEPIMAPGSPARWADRIRVSDNSASNSDASLRELWKGLVSIRDARIRLIGLRMPNEELADIGRTVVERARKTEELAERYASLSPGYVPPGKPKPYPRGRADSLPFEEARTEPYRDPAGGFVAVRTSTGRVLHRWSTADCQRVERLGASNFQVGCRGSILLADRRGQPRSFDGSAEFQRVETIGGELVATREVKRHEPLPGPCWSGEMSDADRSRLYSSQWEAERRIKDFYEWVERKRKRDWEEAEARGLADRNTAFVCAKQMKRPVEVVRFVLSPSLSIIRKSKGYEIR